MTADVDHDPASAAEPDALATIRLSKMWFTNLPKTNRRSPASVHRPCPPDVDFVRRRAENKNMEIPGRVQNGVVVLEGGAALPDGTPVTVVCDTLRISRKSGKRKRVKLPLVESKNPGSLHLTNKRIAEIFEEEDLASFRKSLE